MCKSITARLIQLFLCRFVRLVREVLLCHSMVENGQHRRSLLPACFYECMCVYLFVRVCVCACVRLSARRPAGPPARLRLPNLQSSLSMDLF